MRRTTKRPNRNELRQKDGVVCVKYIVLKIKKKTLNVKKPRGGRGE
jgi:hypothetical protein